MAWLWGSLAGASLLLRPFWLALAPFLPACPFRTLTGVPCPSCGATHAAVALLHGGILEALACNPLATAAGLVFLGGGGLAPLWAALKGPMLVLPAPLPLKARCGIAAALLTGWGYVILASR